jgi:hypothetical protein
MLACEISSLHFTLEIEALDHSHHTVIAAQSLGSEDLPAVGVVGQANRCSRRSDRLRLTVLAGLEGPCR